MRRFSYALIIVVFTSSLLLSGSINAQQSEPTYGGYEKFVSLKTEWSILINLGADVEPWFIQQTSDGGYVIVGDFESTFETTYAGQNVKYEQSDIVLVKYDSNGNFQWSSLFSGEAQWPLNDWSYSVQQTSDGGYIIAGEANSNIVVDWYNLRAPNGTDAFLIRTDKYGQKLWSRTFGGEDDSEAKSVKQTSDGGYIVAGITVMSDDEGGINVYLVKFNSNGNMEWSKVIGGARADYAEVVKQTSDGGYIVAGSTSSFGAGEEDAFIIRTDGKGNVLWSKTFGGKYNEEARNVEETKDGGYILSGWTSSFGAGGKDVYLIKTDSDGNEEWSRVFGAESDDAAYEVKQTQDGGYIVGGYTQKLNDKGELTADAYIIKVDKNGKLEWARTLGTPYEDDQIMPSLFMPTSDEGYIYAQLAELATGEYKVFVFKVKPSFSETPSETTSGNFKVSSLSIEPTVAEEGEQVRISVTVTNIGNVEGTYTVMLKINGETLSTRDVTLKAGKSTTVSWSTSPSWTAGTYNVEVNGLTGSFTIIKPSETTPEMDSKISISASPSSIKVGESTIISGSVSQPQGRANVTIQFRLKGGSWSNLTLVVTNLDGSYSYYWTPPQTGTYELRALLESDGHYDAYASGTISITVEEPSPQPCVIMTAAYGSPLAEEVVFLRHVRDDLIGSTPIGHQLVNAWNTFYYAWSPPLAQAISQSETAKALFRTLLTPLFYAMHPIAIQYQCLAWISPELAAINAFITAATIATTIYITLPAITITQTSKIIKKKWRTYHTQKRA